MRNEAMERLTVLVGRWRTTMRNAWILEPADLEVPGSATVEWLSDAFVVFRWTRPHLRPCVMRCSTAHREAGRPVGGR